MPNESAKIILAVTNGKLSKVRDALAVEGTINALKCGFQFRTQDWDGTTKTAVFVRGRATPSTTNADITYVILDENNECDVPAEILEKDGMFSVGVFGESENYRIVSNWMCYKIADGCYADGSTPVDPGSSIYNQLIKLIQSKSDKSHNHNEIYYTKDESEDRFVSQEELNELVTTPDWNQNDETANDYIKNKPTIPTTLAELSDDDAHRTVTDIEKSEWNEKATNEEVDSKIASIKPLIITLTQNETGDYIADKTFVEISTAIKSGQTAILLDTTKNEFFPFIYLDEKGLEFGMADVYFDEATGYYYFIDVDDSIECISSRLNKIPNPNPLIFTGAVSATYDGSNTVNVNTPQGITNEEVDSKIAAEMQTIKPKSTAITLPAANWTGSNNLFSQEVTIDGITANSKIDLQPTPEQFLELQEGNITLMVSNNNGTATAYAMNFKPTNDYEMQVLITEVTSI